MPPSASSSLRVRLPVLLGVALGDVHVEIRLDLVDEADILARELAAGAREGAQVGADEVGARVVPDPRRPRQLGQQALGLAGQVGGVRRAARLSTTRRSAGSPVKEST